MGGVSTNSENSDSGAQTMRRKLIIWTQRHRRPLTVVLYLLLISVIAIAALVPSYVDAILVPLFGGGGGSVAAGSDVEQSVGVDAPRPPSTAVVRKVFDLPFVPQRDFLCDEMHLMVSVPNTLMISYSCRLTTYVNESSHFTISRIIKNHEF